MFDVSWGEFFVVGVVALLVIGPRELPGVLRNLGRGVSKLKQMAGEFRGQFDDAMREAELHEVKKDFTEAAASTTSFNPIETIRSEIKDAVEKVRGDAGRDATALDGAQNEASAQVIANVERDARALEAEIAIGASQLPEIAPISSAAFAPVVEAPASAPLDPVLESEPLVAKRKRAAKPVHGDA
jgi:sec-independent protein translocase protein TatB